MVPVGLVAASASTVPVRLVFPLQSIFSCPRGESTLSHAPDWSLTNIRGRLLRWDRSIVYGAEIKGGRVFLTPLPCRLLDSPKGLEDRDRLLDVGVDLPLSRTVDDPVATIDIACIGTSVHLAGNVAS